MRNSNRENRVFQAKLDGSEAIPLWVWRCYGVRTLSELEECGLVGVWVFSISDVYIWDKLVRRKYFRERLDYD